MKEKDTSHNQEWKIEYDNDCDPYWEWWDVVNDNTCTSFRCSREESAKWLCDVLNGLYEKEEV